MSTPPHPDGDAGALDRVVRAAPLAALTAYAWQVVMYARHISDDAFITYRYARNLALGLGAVFNPHEAVEGYSNPLHMVTLAAVSAVAGGAAVPVAAKAIGIAAGAAVVWLAHRLALTILRSEPLLAPNATAGASAAALLTALYPGLALWATSGLETTAFAAAVAAATWLGIAARGVRGGGWVGAAWAAAALSRPEGPAVFGAWWAVALMVGWRNAGRRRALATAAAVVAIAVAVHLSLRMAAYGELLPNTFWAKRGGFFGSDGLDYLRASSLVAIGGVVGAVIAAAGWIRLHLPQRALPVAAVAVAGALLPLVTGADWMPGGRFAVPFLAPLTTAAVVGWLALVSPPSRHRRLVGSVVVAAAAAGGLLGHGALRAELREWVTVRAAGYATGHERLARWIADGAAAPGDTVALMDIGIVGWLCPEQRILDISGLTDRHIGRSPGGLLDKRFDVGYVLDQEPRVIVLVLTAAVDPRSPELPPAGDLGTWTRTEATLAADPGFRAHYIRSRRVEPWMDDSTALAARLGAERVFVHAHPGQHYLLAAYVRGRPPADRSATLARPGGASNLSTATSP